MKRIIAMGILTMISASLLGACRNAEVTEGSAFDQRNASNVTDEKESAQASSHAFPESLKEIPEEYFSPAKEQGTLKELNYETYESMGYEEKSQRLEKRAIVYLPYGYNEEQKYNVFYFMHGGWSDETTTLGTPGKPSSFKNVIDHGMENGEIEPMIIVCPTYNNLSGSDSGDYGLALRLTENYHNELTNDLIPAVEGAYSGYADSTSKEDLIAARDHRGFGGFSMGSVTTWRTFEYCLDYFRYFMPMSGNLTTDGGYMDRIVKESGYQWNDFFILAMTGTSDFAGSAFERQIKSMREYTDSFRYGDSEEDANLTYRIKEGYSHDFTASSEYTYNGFCWFWNGGDV